MLTARAAGIVLRNISQVDSFKAEWMQEYFTKVRTLAQAEDALAGSSGRGWRLQQPAAGCSSLQSLQHALEVLSVDRVSAHVGAAAAGFREH